MGKRELILVLFVRLFGLCLFGFVGFLFLLVSGKGCGLWLWHSLDFSLTFCFFQKFQGTFKAFCLLLLIEQMRYPPSANLSQVQTLLQNRLHTAFWYASITSYIFDRQSRILFDNNLYSSDVSLGNRGFRPSRSGIIFNRKFASIKSCNPPKTVRTEMVGGPNIPHNSLNICFESILSLMRLLI